MPHHDLARLEWRKSARSTDEGACVEVASLPRRIAVRDSKNPQGGLLEISRPEFHDLAARIRRGQLDL